MNSSLQIQDKFPPTCTIYKRIGGKPEDYSSLAYAIFTAMIIINVATFPFTIVLNLLVMIAVKTRVRLQSMSNILLACLASTDVMVGLVVQPLRIAVFIILLKGETTSGACLVHVLTAVFSFILCLVSVEHLLLMTVDRYFAIMRPYSYDRTITRARLMGGSCLSWILTAAKQILWLLNRDLFTIVNSVVLLLLLVGILVCNVVLYFEVRRHEKQIADQQVSLEARENFLKQRRAFKLTMTVVALLFISYLPIFIFRVVMEPLKNKISLGTFCALSLIPGSLAALNSLMNPFIYCIRSRRFRVAFIELLMGKSYSEAKEFEKNFFGSNAVATGASQSSATRSTTEKQEGTGEEHYVNRNDMNITDDEANQGDNRKELHYVN